MVPPEAFSRSAAQACVAGTSGCAGGTHSEIFRLMVLSCADAVLAKPASRPAANSADATPRAAKRVPDICPPDGCLVFVLAICFGDLRRTVAHRARPQKTAGAGQGARDKSLLANAAAKNQFFDAVQIPEHMPPFQVPAPVESVRRPMPLACSRPLPTLTFKLPFGATWPDTFT